VLTRPSDFFKKIDLKDDESEQPWKMLKDCSIAFGECLDAALKTAFEETITPLRFEKGAAIPISPLIAEGEDFLIVLRKELAMRFVSELLEAYSALTKANVALQSAATNSQPLRSFVFTLSGAVVFARSGFPFSVLSDMSVALEKSAKNLRNGLSNPQPCLDVYWLESTAREDPLVARESSLTYTHDSQHYSLNTRPWTLEQTEAMWKAAQALAVPRSKWHQLLAGLWSGEPLASFHYQRWMQHLSGPQLKSRVDATNELSRVGFWNQETAPWLEDMIGDLTYHRTPLLELHQLREMLDTRESEDVEVATA
jgi:hypothetical protein